MYHINISSEHKLPFHGFFMRRAISQCQMYHITILSNAYPIHLTWCALQIKSKSCLCKNLATTSAPNVNDTPLSFSPQPIVSCQAKENGLFKQVLIYYHNSTILTVHNSIMVFKWPIVYYISCSKWPADYSHEVWPLFRSISCIHKHHRRR